jgi:F0F1-type ATP synthase assembly protein I
MREKRRTGGQADGRDGGEAGAYRYASLGIAFAAGILIFLAAGYGLDRWLGTMPFGTITGTMVGAVLGFLSVYRRVMGDAAKDKAAQRPKDRLP